MDQPTNNPQRPRRVWQWMDIRNRKLGMIAYVLNRITGLGLVVYLYLHLAVLSQLTKGAAGWDGFVAMARSPLFLMFDVVLLAGLLIHALNGLRIVITSVGAGAGSQKNMFVAFMTLAAVLLAVGAFLIFTK
jgi:succinate dehydrogenase / fumarate reductase cytochrome b subunit